MRPPHHQNTSKIHKTRYNRKQIYNLAFVFGITLISCTFTDEAIQWYQGMNKITIQLLQFWDWIDGGDEGRFC